MCASSPFVYRLKHPPTQTSDLDDFLLNDFIILNENLLRFSYWFKAFNDVSVDGLYRATVNLCTALSRHPTLKHFSGLGQDFQSNMFFKLKLETSIRRTGVRKDRIKVEVE